MKVDCYNCYDVTLQGTVTSGFMNYHYAKSGINYVTTSNPHTLDVVTGVKARVRRKTVKTDAFFSLLLPGLVPSRVGEAMSLRDPATDYLAGRTRYAPRLVIRRRIPEELGIFRVPSRRRKAFAGDLRGVAHCRVRRAGLLGLALADGLQRGLADDAGLVCLVEERSRR